MALEMQKIYEEDSARLKRQKSGRASRSDPAKGIMKKKYCISDFTFKFHRGEVQYYDPLW